MKKLLPFLLFLAACTSHVKNKFGLMAPVQSTLNYSGLSNQTIVIPAGTYSGINASNLTNVKIDASAADFSGLVTVNSCNGLTLYGGTSLSINGDAILWNGNSSNCTERKWSFENVSGNCNNASDNVPYVGTVASLKFYQMVFDSLIVKHSGLVLQGSWGDASNKVCYMDSVIFSNVTVDNTVSNGTETRGVIFRLNAYNWHITYPGMNNVLGDVGVFYNVGNGSFHDNFKTGGRGYWLREWHVCLPGMIRNSYFYNNIDLNTSTYGTIDTRCESGQFTQYSVPGGQMYVQHNTSGNKYDNIGYWSSILEIGSCNGGFRINFDHNLGFNITPCCGTNSTGKPKIAEDQSNGTWSGDSSSNLYLVQGPPAVDTLTGKQANYQGIGAVPGAVVVVPPAPPTPTTCDTVGIIAAYVKAHPCPIVVPCVQRTAIGYSVNAKTGAINFSYDNGTQSLKRKK